MKRNLCIAYWILAIALWLWATSSYSHWEFPGDPYQSPWQWSAWDFCGFHAYWDSYGGRDYWTMGPSRCAYIELVDGKIEGQFMSRTEAFLPSPIWFFVVAFAAGGIIHFVVVMRPFCCERLR